ncbi:MAG: hypothetical protein ACTIJJ_09775 [Galactobacter sp.]|uniref:hypothetical protein n=1 Tax=Galactobacter sp. TaxID=2676125 RepID=UPI0025BFC261|nr:hypothetical protein [Galactobacter sp.]
MRHSLRTLTVTTGATALALSLALTGCGGDNPKPANGQGQAVSKEGPAAKDALEKAKTNMKAWKTVSFTGTVTEDDTEMKVEASGSVKESGDFQLTMSGTVEGKDQSANILSVDGKMYMKGSEDFYSGQMGDGAGDMAKLIGGKYLEIPTSQAEGMDDMSLHSFMDEVMNPEDMDLDDLDDPEAKGKLVKFEGVQAYEYKVSDDEDTTMYLSTDGSDQFLGFKSAEEGQFVFKDFNKDFSFKAPSKDEVVSMEDLMKGAQGN